MPTYEYACRNCGEHLEVVQSFSDDPLTECPRCEGPLRKVFGTIGIAFKGSGFYKTDSRSSTSASRSSGDSASAGGKDSKDGKGGKEGKDGAKKDGGSKDTSSPSSSSSGSSSEAKSA